MPPSFLRTARPWISAATCLALVCTAWAADERPPSKIEVEEWSVWVVNPAQATVNAARVSRNAMPGAVGTSRPKFEAKELEGKFPVAPISVVQFFGEPLKDVDVELRAKKGTFLAHWPPASDRGGRLQWFKSDLIAAPPAELPQVHLPGDHWFQALRRADAALYLKNGSRFDRFLAYDAELTLPTPVKIRGGPDEYTLQNLTGRRLMDVAVVAPTEKGYRVGWLDELPSASPEEDADARKKEEDDKKAEAKKTDAQKAESVFKEAESKEEKPKEEAPPLPAEGDANVRAAMDQVLNRPVTASAEKATSKEALDLIAAQARLRYELDDATIAKADVDLGGTTSLKVAGVAARDALADVLGNLGLSYRVTETGSLYITTSARLAEDASKKGSVVEGPPIQLTLSQPLAPDNPSYRELTLDNYARRLTGQGLREGVVRTLLAEYGRPIFQPGELIVVAHLTREAIDEAVLLDVFPAPARATRTAVVVVHGVDPRLQDRARDLVQRLGDRSPKAREEAEARLLEMGPAAVPVLEDALVAKDLEIVFRAERLLLKLNRPVP